MDENVEVEGPRTRTLSEKAQEEYEQKCAQFKETMSSLYSAVCNTLASETQDKLELIKIRKECIYAFEDFARFLEKTRSWGSLQELKEQEIQLKTILDKIDTAIQQQLSIASEVQIKSEKTDSHFAPKGSKSHPTPRASGSRSSQRPRSSHSQITCSSTASTVIAKQRARAEAMRVRLQYAHEEADILQRQAEQEARHRQEQANLKAHLKVLTSKRDYEEASAELNALESTMDANNIFSPIIVHEDLSVAERERTEQYVSKTANEAHTNDQIVHEEIRQLNPETPSFVPKSCPTLYGVSPAQPQVTAVNELTKYIMKKDLILSRLSQFNDRPERYMVWKSSFKNITKELEVSPTEELDLLCRWLGPESSTQASSLRAANCTDESEAIRKIWTRLDQRYGAPELVVQSFQQRLNQLPKLTTRDSIMIYELSDLLTELESLKEDKRYRSSLAYLDSSAGVNHIVEKLPLFMQGKWTDRAIKYKSEYDVMYPLFTLFSEFIRSMASRMNDPSFKFESTSQSATLSNYKSLSNHQNKLKKGAKGNMQNSADQFAISAKKTEITNQKASKDTCPLHGDNAKHSLRDCRTFLSKSFPEKQEIVLKNGICFKCCVGKHLAKDCKVNIKCEKCNKTSHCTPFHKTSPTGHGGEQGMESGKNGDNVTNNCTQDSATTNVNVDNKCTQICGNVNNICGKSCSKTVLVRIFPEGRPEEALKAYAIIDDQSNRSLARSELFDHFRENSVEMEYIISSCTGSVTTSGRRASGYVIQSHDRTCNLRCPTLIECNEIPQNRHEIPTPSVARNYKHMKEIEPFIPEPDPESEILLLIGRDLIAAHHILDQRIGSDTEPYAQQLRLGWVIVGEASLGKTRTHDVVTANKIRISQQCCHSFQLKENTVTPDAGVFQKTPYDEDLGLSQEDREFYEIMQEGFIRSPEGRWSAPLPFRQGRPRLPNNYQHALKRAENLKQSLARNPTKEQHFLTFMAKNFDNKHAEEAPPTKENEELWYLPIFGVYNPKKPNKVRVVFDSSAKYKGICLNDILITGPDLTNNLVGVLLKFRKERIAVTADVEQMFFNFEVHEKHRNLLRFLWFRDNDPNKEIVEYRMRVHVFGNSPSPAVATYGLRKAVCNHEEEGNHCDEICAYVKGNFYVDDALVSCSSETEAINLIKETQERLMQGGNIRLHKIASNSSQVLKSFPLKDLADDVEGLQLNSDASNCHRSLGLSWDVTRDIFTYKVSKEMEEKPYTKRGLLSVVHSVFDPLGFVAPVVLGGRLIMREIIRETTVGWDDLLPDIFEAKWRGWKQSLKDLEMLEIPRTFTHISPEEATRRELHIFSDASKDAIGAVGYLKVYDAKGNSELGFVLGKSKVAPEHGHTIPRLELCAAVLAAEMSDFILKQLDVSLDKTYFYTDSQVVLGYLNNRTRRFHIYVGNRVGRILSITSSSQWGYVPTEANPADHGTRPLNASDLGKSSWFKGPKDFLTSWSPREENKFQLINPEQDKEIRLEAQALKSSVAEKRIGTDRFSRFSSWKSLTSAFARLKQRAASHRKCDDLAIGTRSYVDYRNDAESFVLKETQRELYSSEIHCLQEGKPLPKNSGLCSLSPILDANGLLRVGGRLKHSHLETGEKTPIIVPGSHHIATLLVRHYHEEVYHQGRQFTEGAIRSAGFWITSGKRLINSVIFKCVKCKKLRGRVETQKMADLPSDRTTPSPPFTYVGVDTFGPWQVVSRRTRGGIANSKRWGIIFSCLVTRGVHIEVIEELSSASFINSLRRFISLRGPVKEFRSDCGTNFIGATGELGISTLTTENQDIKNFLAEHKTLWKFNPPHASHMSGAWERMIGLARRILDSMLCDIQGKQLTHEVLCTLMAEVCAIINNRPIACVSNDPDSPTILSPNVLLTQKLNAEYEPAEQGTYTSKEMYKSQWRHVQILSDQFWKRWTTQYLQNLQSRPKWQSERRNLQVGDVVLLLDSSLPRNQWPVGMIERTFPSSDGLVRKITVRVTRNNTATTYVRPVTQVIYLCSQS